MNFCCLFLGLVFAAAGVLFFIGKGLPLMSVWKQMSTVEKEKINASSLGKNIGIILLLAAICFLLSGISIIFRQSAFTWCMIFWMVITGADVYFIGKSDRYIIK